MCDQFVKYTILQILSRSFSCINETLSTYLPAEGTYISWYLFYLNLRFSGGGEDLSQRSSSCAVMRNSEIGFEHQTSSSNSGVGFEHQTSSSNSGIGFEHQTSSSSSASVQDIFYDALDTVTRHSTDTGLLYFILEFRVVIIISRVFQNRVQGVIIFLGCSRIEFRG